MSRIVTLIALALATAAVGCRGPDRPRGLGPNVDPLAVSKLLGKGYTPSR